MVLYDLLSRAAVETLQNFRRDPQWLGGGIGIAMVLHTWGQHVHLDCLVPGGVLSADGERWIDTKPCFLFKVKALAKAFHAKYLSALKAAHAAGPLRFAVGTAPLADPDAFSGSLEPLWQQVWVVYAKAPFSGPEQVMDYLRRYTHRTAISNDRLKKMA